MKNTMKKPVNIPVSKLRPFEGHPFKVKDDEEMNTLLSSEKHTVHTSKPGLSMLPISISVSARETRMCLNCLTGMVSSCIMSVP